jgi:hypothetical protein
MRGRTDLTVLDVSRHAAKRYCTRVLGAKPSGKNRQRATERLKQRLRGAEPLGEVTHNGTTGQAWRLEDCVVMTKQGCVTTVYTHAMWEQGRDGIEGATG